MEWVFAGLLLAVSAGITGFTGYLLYRLFRTEPVVADPATGGEAGGE